MFHLLRNADVYAPQQLGRVQILVSEGKIVWIGAEDLELPPALSCGETDLGGRRTLPGLIDLHAHITGGGGECGPTTRVPPLSLTDFSTAGISTVIGVLGTDGTTRNVASLLAAARSLDGEGLSAWCYTGSYQIPPITLTGDVRGDIVHIDKIIGVGEIAISDHRSSQPTLDELLRLASDAHVAGLMSGKAGILHLHVGDGARGLAPIRSCLEQAEIPARTYHPTHVNRHRGLFAEAIDLAKLGCTIDVTAFPADENTDQMSASEAWLAWHEAGAPADRLTISSDGGGCMPRFDEQGQAVSMDVGQPQLLAATMTELLNAGQSLEAVAPAFTTNPANLLRLANKGRIGIGADADLAVLDDSNRVTDLMIAGTWHVRDGKPMIFGTFESPTS